MAEMTDLLQDARAEILHLRRRNEVLAAKVEMIELFACVLHTRPAVPVEGMGEDIAWKLQKKIDEIGETDGAPTPASRLGGGAP